MIQAMMSRKRRIPPTEALIVVGVPKECFVLLPLWKDCDYRQINGWCGANTGESGQ